LAECGQQARALSELKAELVVAKDDLLILRQKRLGKKHEFSHFTDQLGDLKHLFDDQKS